MANTTYYHDNTKSFIKKDVPYYVFLVKYVFENQGVARHMDRIIARTRQEGRAGASFRDRKDPDTALRLVDI